MFLAGCSSSVKPAPDNVSSGDTSVRTDQDDNLSDLIADVKGNLPLTIENKWLQLKDVELDKYEEVLTLFIFNDENIRGDWWGDNDDKYWGKFIVAQLVGIPEIMESISSEEAEELMEDGDFQEIWKNIPNYRKVRTLLKSVSDKGYSLRLRLHSRDNYTNNVDLVPEETKDAVVFYKEVLMKVQKDHTVENPF